MSKQHDRLWEIMSSVTACMVTTQDGNVLRARPMAPFIDIEAKTIQFVTDDDSAKVDELMHNRDLCLTFADDKKMLFASVSGRGQISRDRSLIRRLWGPYCDVFFSGGPEDAKVVVITLDATQAEYWDNDTNSMLMAYEVSKAYFTDSGPKLGDNAKLDM